LTNHNQLLSIITNHNQLFFSHSSVIGQFIASDF